MLKLMNWGPLTVKQPVLSLTKGKLLKMSDVVVYTYIINDNVHLREINNKKNR